MKTKRLLLMLILAPLLLVPFADNVYSEEGANLYREGYSAARRREMDLAFMSFNALVRDYPESKFFADALFSLGEYYFSVSDYYDANRFFDVFISKYPNSKARPFACAYLIEIAKMRGEKEYIKKLQKEIITFKQIGLLFSDFKKHAYLSGFSKKYKALYFIDRVEIYIDNELFTKILL